MNNFDEMKGGAIDWDYCWKQAMQGRLQQVLETEIPRKHWMDVSSEHRYPDFTLLHIACNSMSYLNHGAIALLLKEWVDPDALATLYGCAAMHFTLMNNDQYGTELLCAAGADAHVKGGRRYLTRMSPLELSFNESKGENAYALLANGYRICSLQYPRFLYRSHIAFESGILACRSAVVATLRLKRIHRNMAHVDRFLMREIALAIWATRSENNDAWAQVKGAKK